jgi:hypothetical protein
VLVPRMPDGVWHEGHGVQAPQAFPGVPDAFDDEFHPNTARKMKGRMMMSAAAMISPNVFGSSCIIFSLRLAGWREESAPHSPRRTPREGTSTLFPPWGADTTRPPDRGFTPNRSPSTNILSPVGCCSPVSDRGRVPEEHYRPVALHRGSPAASEPLYRWGNLPIL